MDNTVKDVIFKNIGFFNHTNSLKNKIIENGEVTGKWESKPNIKWIFTYRQGFYNFPELNNIFKIEKVQPLLGLNEQAVNSALNKFNPSIDFVNGVIDKGKVI